MIYLVKDRLDIEYLALLFLLFQMLKYLVNEIYLMAFQRGEVAKIDFGSLVVVSGLAVSWVMFGA